jgi:hypothetical protein
MVAIKRLALGNLTGILKWAADLKGYPALEFYT